MTILEAKEEARKAAIDLTGDARELMLGAISMEVWRLGMPKLLELGIFEPAINPWGQRYSTLTDFGRQVVVELDAMFKASQAHDNQQRQQREETEDPS